MMIIRPITGEDYDALWQIANKTGPGFTSLQPNREAVEKRLQLALLSMSDDPPEEALYLFVMEDTANNNVVGVCGIESAVGLSAPWYNYKVSSHVHASKELDVYHNHDTLNLCSDHTGYSELCTLFLDQEYRHSQNGQLLSKSRLLFLAAHASKFNENILAEMRGYSDSEGQSPFWEGLGRHFFSVDYDTADQQVSNGKSFIAELMPRHPIYVNLLPKEAQACIGKTHKKTLAARKILESEGFKYTGYIDIFDGGPLLETSIENIRAVRESALYTVRISDNTTVSNSQKWLIANNQFTNYRCGLSALSFDNPSYVLLTTELANCINVKENDKVRVTPLLAQKTKTSDYHF